MRICFSGRYNPVHEKNWGFPIVSTILNIPVTAVFMDFLLKKYAICDITVDTIAQYMTGYTEFILPGMIFSFHRLGTDSR